jgi:hypothetical protein
VSQFRVVNDQVSDRFTALSQFGFVVAEPRTAFFNDIELNPQSIISPDFEIPRRTKCRIQLCGKVAHFVFHHFNPDIVSCTSSPSLIWPISGYPDEPKHRTSGHFHRGGFGISKHYPDFFAQLVNKNAAGFGFLMFPVSFLNACDINRACNPIFESPISPSSSALGVRRPPSR